MSLLFVQCVSSVCSTIPNHFILYSEYAVNVGSLSECYFAGKGTALVLPDAEAQKSAGNSSQNDEGGNGQGTNIQKHLQSMFYLLRPEETLKMAVKLESVHPSRTRYLVVVSRMGIRGEESCLLGIDCNEKTTVGLVLKVLANTAITLDGDGGFSVSVCDRHHIFKPVSVQAMWSALQTLHKVSAKAREQNYFQGGMTHGWVNYYEQRIKSDRSCLNEWHAMDNLESKRPPSPDSIRTKPTEREETEKVIRATLKEIMMSVDLDEVTSKFIRSRLEEELDMDLGEYKSFIDQEMLVILGQMDAPTEIFDHVYLGSEWNASNYEELQRNGVSHILNVTREIDNFFPGTFDYLNVRVYDDEKTDLLKHWDDTFKYITKARNSGSKVLVHCKMGVSRSASVVIAYAMKAYNWDFDTAMQHVKEKRTCIKPNKNFLLQLQTYQGILDAMKNKEKLQRSKSETNLKAPKLEKVLPLSEPTPIVQAMPKIYDLQTTLSGQDLRQLGVRPKSWSPDNLDSAGLVTVSKSSPVFLSLEELSQKSSSKESVKSVQQTNDGISSLARHVLMPCDNGENYSVSPNRIVHLPASVKERISELEGSDNNDKKKLVLNLQTKFEEEEASVDSSCSVNTNFDNQNSPRVRTSIVKEIWDPGDQKTTNEPSILDSTIDSCDLRNNSVSESQTVWTSSTVLKNVPETLSAVPSSNNLNDKVPESQQTKTRTTTVRRDSDPFSNQLDRVFDKEEKRQQRLSAISVAPSSVPELSTDEKTNRECPSRQNSWSSYDSAVILGYQNENELSRNSSWGSGDTRTLPSRNSSWGSYDMRPRGPCHYVNEAGEKVLHPEILESSSGIFPYDKEDIPWYPGTVRRSKQKIEENSSRKCVDSSVSDSLTSSSVSIAKSPSSETLLFDDFVSDRERPAEAVNTVLVESSDDSLNRSSSAISEKIDIPGDELSKATSISRLSISAPEPSSMELVPHQDHSLSRSASNVSNVVKIPDDSSSLVISTTQCSSVKQHKQRFLENLHSRDRTKTKKLEDPLETSNASSKVRSLKKEFEAKSSTKEPAEEASKSKPRVSSLPSSPVSVHIEKQKNEEIEAIPEDLNFKNLRDIFEKNKEDGQVNMRQKLSPSKPFGQNRNKRFSCIEVSVEKSPVRITQTPLISTLTKNGSLSEKNDGEYKRPPIVPVVRNTSPGLMVAATVIAKAAKKQQQYGKSHPLARLNIKPRHNNPVYNTM